MTTAVSNPYLDAFVEWAGPGEPWRERAPFTFGWPDDRHNMRDRLCKQYAWAIPTAEAIAACVAWSPLVEIGAGTGYWAHLMRQAGADVVAYDWLPVGRGENGYHEYRWENSERKQIPVEPHTHVEEGNTRILSRHGDRTLFLCWPPYGSPTALAALRRHQRAGGTRIIYVGEGDGGCTGSALFHETLSAEYNEVRVVSIPQWPGIHDRMYCHERK